MERPDPIERRMDCFVEDMTPAEMAAYMKMYLKAMCGIDLPQDGIKERKTFEAFKRRYPNGKAGLILQWVMMHHGGRIHAGKFSGEYVTSAQFSNAMGWWHDMMFVERQTAEQRNAGMQSGNAELKAMFSGADSMV